ncbi:unnamed protein product [Spodoptera littoralis]|uniref:Sperm microtubule inner protein 1 C-terminal domain-containing protein n=1 Tax=Spodoptera littoralis TaxID=7109 RepID=A0A9P0MZU8_SPOLI|nr:unnamed protein product [Spodoptera littoralis]CAH1637338.1 unnamed protein product [Spodoptera littoralis]
MPLDYSNPLIQKFLIERQHQENLKCMNWFLKNKEKIIKNAPKIENCKHYTTEQISKTHMEAGMNMLSKQNDVSIHHRRKTPMEDAETTILNGFFEKSEEVPIMKPVDPKESSILYTDLAAGGGRNAYLNTRHHKLPEDKYTFCVTTYNNYGWKLNENELKRSPPEHNRYSIFVHDLVRRSGAHPDPPESLKPNDAQYKKCVGL